MRIDILLVSLLDSQGSVATPRLSRGIVGTISNVHTHTRTHAHARTMLKIQGSLFFVGLQREFAQICGRDGGTLHVYVAALRTSFVRELCGHKTNHRALTLMLQVSTSAAFTWASTCFRTALLESPKVAAPHMAYSSIYGGNSVGRCRPAQVRKPTCLGLLNCLGLTFTHF